MPSTQPNISDQILYVEDVRRELHVGERVARQVLHEAGVRLGRRRLAITRDALLAYLRRRDGEEAAR